MTEPTSSSMRGRVVVVTGGTSGIGLEIVRGLAIRGAHAVVVGRGPGRAEAVADEMRRSTGNPDVEAVEVTDLGARAEWSHLAQELRRRLSALHVLVNNAGAYYARRETTEDGLERSFALNVLAPLALTTLLQDRLRSSAPARVVNVASAAHEGHDVHLDDLQGVREYHGYGAYGRSKLELILLTRELARRFAGTGVTVNSVHPGFVRSGFGLNNGGGTAFLLRTLALVMGKSPRRGAVLPIRLASDPELANVSGAYFSRSGEVSGSPASRDLAMARRLYDACLPVAELPEIPLPTELR
jgi:NAD(P)-dependent dehydrogenase (short-subunit alcohol dehydrogenase family)